MRLNKIIVAQIGAREHYAVPRALFQADLLESLLTECWVPPHSIRAHLFSGPRFRSRYHRDLQDAPVASPKLENLIFETFSRWGKRSAGWNLTLARNAWFQRWVCDRLRRIQPCQSYGVSPRVTSVFSYSYAARSIFHVARQYGWTCLLGQIDPGPTHEELVAAEHRRYPQLLSRWQPAPPIYWQAWADEINLADKIIVNSSWSWRCLHDYGVPQHKLQLIPLVYESPISLYPQSALPPASESNPFQLLFLGTICLGKGIARLLDAMRILEGQAVQLTLAGPSEIDPQVWATSPNIHWLGPVPRSQVGSLYTKSHAMILPTLSDGFAITQLESLAFGCPVITSQFCGEVVKPGFNGWILPSLEPEVIAATIREAMVTSHLLTRPLQRPSFGLSDLADAFRNFSLPPTNP